MDDSGLVNGGTVAYATDATVPRVSVLHAIENFLQDISLADGRGAPHFVRTHSRVFFPDQVYSPSRSFQFCTPTVTISISFTPTTPRPPAYAPASALSLSRNNRVFFGSHFPFFRVPHPASDNQLHRPQRAATCWNWAVLILRIGGSQKGGASSIKPASRARLQILLPSLVLCSPRVPP